MVHALLLGAALVTAPAEVTLRPTDDIWVYPHASDPEKDPFLRVWGSEAKAVPTAGEPAQNFSFSYLRFDLSKLPTGTLKRAELRLTHVGDPSFTLEDAKKAPLEVRPVEGDFLETTWDYAMAEKTRPAFDAKTVFGSAAPEPAEKDFRVSIDLMKGPGDFAAAFARARSATAPLRLALTSALDPEAQGMRTIYKLYSKDAGEEAQRPVLVLEFDSGK